MRGEILASVEALFDVLPEGGPDEKAAVLCGAVLEASGLKGGDEWCCLARLVSDAHGGKPAAVVVEHSGRGRRARACFRSRAMARSVRCRLRQASGSTRRRNSDREVE